ncbi:MAG TPA: POT family MFS transporter [Elusimicrobiota bacterium]|nr:POT family MFS transporter [Elusimicrobiota bacterium]
MTTETPKKFPPQIKYIIGNEACERFSYYGMRAILVVYMTEYLKMASSDATSLYHFFVSACYLFPVLGAWISDRWWGKYRTIMILSMGYCLGHATLAAFDGKGGMYWGLLLISLGSGGIKPCVSAFVGDQFTAENKSLVSKVFDLFYFSVNFGSFFSTLLIPWMLPKFGPSWAFGLPGILMGIATLILWIGRAQYVNVPPTGGDGKAGFLTVLAYAVSHRAERKPGEELMSPARAKYSAEEVEGAQAVWGLLKLFSTVSIFWSLWDQYGSSWVIQAKMMDLRIFGFPVEAAQISAINPILVMLLIPACSMYLYPGFERLTGIKLTPLRRIGGGMALTAVAFLCAAAVQLLLNRGVKLSVSWQFVQYTVITVSEVMLSITGLEFAYTQAPRSMKSTIMSLWLLTIFAGNFLTAWVDKISLFPVESVAYYLFFTALMAAVTVIFVFCAMRYTVHDYLEKGDDGPPADLEPGVAADATTA